MNKFDKLGLGKRPIDTTGNTNEWSNYAYKHDRFCYDSETKKKIALSNCGMVQDIGGGRGGSHSSAEGETGIAPVDAVIDKTLEAESTYLSNPIVQFAVLGLAIYGGVMIIKSFK